MSPNRSTFYRRAALCFVAIFSFFLQGIAGETPFKTQYVYLRDGTIRVFPDSCIQKILRDRITDDLCIISLDGKSHNYLRDDYDDVTDTPR